MKVTLQSIYNFQFTGAFLRALDLHYCYESQLL